MIPVGSTDTFWGTAAQVGVVLLLAAVIEARFLVRRWAENTPTGLRKSQGVFLALALAAVWLSVVLCVSVLASRVYVLWELFFVLLATGLGFGIAVLLPVLRILVAAFALDVVRAGRRSERAKVATALAGMESIAVEDLESNLKTLTLIEGFRDNARERLKEARAAGESSDYVEMLEDHLRSLNADVKTYRKNLARSVNAFDDAERLPAQIEEAMAKTDKAEAAMLAREQTENPEN